MTSFQYFADRVPEGQESDLTPEQLADLYSGYGELDDLDED